jgi:hypothetical protein
MRQAQIGVKGVISPAMRKNMRAINAAAHFLLVLRPGAARLDFLAVADADYSIPALDECQNALDLSFSNKIDEIKYQGEQRISSLSNSAALFALCREVIAEAQQIAPHLSLNEQQIRAVAVHWLEQESILLGDAPSLPVIGAQKRWRSTLANQSQLRFQDAIDWCAGYDCSLEAAHRENDGERYYGYKEVGSVVLKVPVSASRPNLVNLTNLKVVLAEHLLAYSVYATSVQPNYEYSQPGLTFFFLPLKGLGQYRAAIDWIGVDSHKINSRSIEAQILDQVTPLQRLGLESLFTQSLINAFTISLRQALRDIHEGDHRSGKRLRHVFADLWWANEVRFYKSGQLHSRLTRADGDQDMTYAVATDEARSWKGCWEDYNSVYQGFLAINGDGHPDLSYIKLSLSSFIRSGGDYNSRIQETLAEVGLSYRELATTVKTLPFDEVIFACYFFQRRSDELAEWADQLGDAVLNSLIEQTIQRSRIIRSRAEALEGAAHWVNSLIRIAGRADAAKKVERAINALSVDHQSRAALERAYHSLQLMILVEAGTGLLRLFGTLDHGDHHKLRDWFTKTSIAEWEKPAAFQKYQNSIVHLARAIGSAFGHARVTTIVDGCETSYTDYCALDLDELRFPPLSKQEKGNEPILALLPVLTEPLSNAIIYMMKNNLHGTGHAIKLQMEDQRHAAVPHILVKIGSPFLDVGQRNPFPGIAITRRLMEFTELAEIDNEIEIEEENGARFLWVTVRLHPQKLAERIATERPV